jgi:hypothetical protein
VLSPTRPNSPNCSPAKTAGWPVPSEARSPRAVRRAGLALMVVAAGGPPTARDIRGGTLVVRPAGRGTNLRNSAGF